MSDRQILAEHATGLGVVGLAAMGLNAAPLIPVAILAAWGIDRFRACAERRQRLTIDAIVKQIEKSDPQHRAVGPALALIKDHRHKVRIAPETLADAEKRGNFPNTLYDTVFGGVEVPRDDGVEELLRLILTTAWQELRKDDDYHKVFVQESVTAIERDMADGFRRVEAGLARLETRIDDIGTALDGVASANRDLLEALAARFRIPDAFDLPDMALRQELEKRAEDYRRLLKDISDLKGVSDRIDNIHAAALDAAEALRLAEAKALLRDARTILRDERLRPVLESNAKLMEAEANIELLDQNPEAAARLLIAAADSFAAIDVLEPARRRITRYAPDLAEHAMRYGGTGLKLSMELVDQAITDALKAADPDLWIRAHHTRATARQEQGLRLEGAAGTDLLHRAIADHRIVLNETDRDATPDFWATSQNNLGNALQQLGIRSDGAESAAFFAEAVRAYRAALEVDLPPDGNALALMIRNNLANALQEQGERTEGAEGLALLTQSVAAHEATLARLDKAANALNWAFVQTNRANTMRKLAARPEAETAEPRLTDALNSYDAVLEIITRPEHPFAWAVIQENVAATRAERAKHVAGAARADDLTAALGHVEAALEVYDPDHMSFNHDMASTLRAEIRAALAALG